MLENLERNTKFLSDPENLYRLIVSELSKKEAEIIDLNTGQLEVGKLSTGKDTREYSNPEYAKLKKSMGSKSGNNMDFKLEGDFYEGFEIDFNNTELTFDSTDEKTAKLTSNLFGGIDIFGLTDENWNEILDELDIGEIIKDELTK